MLVTYGYSSEQEGAEGSVRSVIVPYSGIYTMLARGAAGHTGTIHNSTTDLDYIGTPGKGAIVQTRVALEAGDEILICVGQSGLSEVTPTTDGSGGGSGGGTFVFRKITSITDSTYQIMIDGVPYECLLVAAGGSGVQDGAYRKTSVNAPDASTLVYSKTNYKAFSSTTQNPASSSGNSGTLSLNQIKTYGFKGCFYTRNNNKGIGGFGCGAAADDNHSFGGGWCAGTTGYQSANWALYDGEARVCEELSNGAFSMSAIVDVVDTILVPEIQSVVISPSAVAVNGKYSIVVSVAEVAKPIILENNFEFAFSNESLTDSKLIMSEIVK